MINPNFYTYRDLSHREYEKSIDYFFKARKIWDSIAREMALVLEAKHRIQSLIYEAQACEALAQSCIGKTKRGLLKSAKTFREIAEGRRKKYGHLYAKE